MQTHRTTLSDSLNETNLAGFVQIAMSSADDVEDLISISHELSYLREEEFEAFEVEVSEIKKILTGLLKKLKADS